MKTTINEEDQISLLEVEGRLDASTAREFDEAVKVLSSSGREGKIVVDLARLEFISSAGLRSLLTLAKTCQKVSRKLSFCSLNTMVAEVFKISGFYSIFSIYPDRAAAKEA